MRVALDAYILCATPLRRGSVGNNLLKFNRVATPGKAITLLDL